MSVTSAVAPNFQESTFPHNFWVQLSESHSTFISGFKGRESLGTATCPQSSAPIKVLVPKKGAGREQIEGCYPGDLLSFCDSAQIEDAMLLIQSVYRSAFLQALIVVALFGPNASGAYASHSEAVCNPRSLWFGEVVTGQSHTLLASVINKGSSPLTVSHVSVSNAGFTIDNFTVPPTLVTGKCAQFGVTFSPAVAGSVNGTIGFDSNVGTNNLPITGKGTADWSLRAIPKLLNFGTVAVGSSLALPLTISNLGTTSQTVSVWTVGGAAFSVTGVEQPLTLAEGQSYTLSVTFAPQLAGTVRGTVLVATPVNPAFAVPLSGVSVTAASQLTVSPPTINFGDVAVGESSSQGGQLTALVSSITVTTATMSTSEFGLSGIILPLTLAAGQKVNFAVSFNPQSSGAASGTLSFASDAINSPTVESLGGTGSTQYSVNLSWNPSSSQVVGYNVYRGYLASGPYAKINTELDPTTAYADTSVSGGQTYYYAATAVNSEGAESTYSNVSQAVIP
jgi:hypothetical protein